MSLGSAIYPFGDFVTLPNIARTPRLPKRSVAPVTHCYVLLPESSGCREERRRQDLRRFPRHRGDAVPSRHGLPPRFHRANDGPFRHLAHGRIDSVERLGLGHLGAIYRNRKLQGSYVEPGRYHVEAHRQDDQQTPPGEHCMPGIPTAIRGRRRSIHEFSIEDIAEAGITVGCGGNRSCPTKPSPGGRWQILARRRLARLARGLVRRDGQQRPRRGDRLASPRKRVSPKGFPNGTFRPDLGRDQGTDGETRLGTLDLPPSPDDWFDDDDNSVHDEAIDSIADAGITKGFSDGTFFDRRSQSPELRWPASSTGGSSMTRRALLLTLGSSWWR